MSAAFLRDITENICLAARDADIVPYVAYAPAGLGHLFGGMLADGTGLVLADGDAEMPATVQGFGRCLQHATQALFALGHSAVCLVNADSPTLPTAVLVQAARALAEPGARCVLGPAEDGGYYLIGQKALYPALFTDITWSTEHVAGQTRQAAAAVGLPMHELATWYDVDDRAALLRLLQELQAGNPGFHPPATAALVAALGLRDRLAA